MPVYYITINSLCDVVRNLPWRDRIDRDDTVARMVTLLQERFSDIMLLSGVGMARIFTRDHKITVST